MQWAVLVVAGGVVLSLGVLFVYAVVTPGNKTGPTPPATVRGSGLPCIYCHSLHTRRLAQEPRYDDSGFALVTAYECMRCGLPFWSVDRSPAGQRSR